MAKAFHSLMMVSTFVAMMFAAPIAVGVLTSSQAVAQSCPQGSVWCCKRTYTGAMSCSCAPAYAC